MPALWESSYQTTSEIQRWNRSQGMLDEGPIIHVVSSLDDNVTSQAMICMKDDHGCMNNDCEDAWNGSSEAMYWYPGEEDPEGLTL